MFVSYNILYDKIHNTEKLKIDSRYNSRFDNYGFYQMAYSLVIHFLKNAKIAINFTI